MLKTVIKSLILIFVAVNLFVYQNNAQATTSITPNKRLVIFISDLHVGVGHDPEKQDKWHPTEDFRWHIEFSDFLDRINEDGKSNVDLILVGDTFELWQSLDKDCYPDDKRCQKKPKPLCNHDDNNLGCSANEANLLIERIIAQHRDFFDALSKFASTGHNHVTLIPGNHDAALLFEKVSETVKAAFKAEAREKITIASEGYWKSEDGKLYAEHGHQIGDDPNKFDNWPTNPFITAANGIKYLQQPWGEGFVQKFYSEYENNFPVIDNLSKESEGIKYAMKAKGFDGSLDAVAKFLRFTLLQTSIKQTIAILGEPKEKDKPPKWEEKDIQALQEKLNNSAKDRLLFLVESLEKQNPMRESIENQIKNTNSFPEIADFTEEEIKDICTKRWVLKIESKGSVDNCFDDRDLGAIKQSIIDSINPESRNKRYREYLTNISTKNQFSIYIYAHTHKIESETEKNKDQGYHPFNYGSSWDPVVFNDGAWQRTATPEQFIKIAKNRNMTASEALKKLQPEDLPACYPFVVVSYINPKKPIPIAKLKYWVQYPPLSGNVASSCP
jgi:UDP-2,3-diacylglucosamine pyrophosphatase LpxH